MTHADYCSQFVVSGDTVLDVGSGRGGFLCAMAAKGYVAMGVEVNPAYIAAAKAEAQKFGVHISVTQGVGEVLSFTDKVFSFVNCAEVTEHVEDPVALCREIFRVLKSEGHAYISFHNRYGVYDYHYGLWFINWLPRSWAEKILSWVGKDKPDGVAGRQQLSHMHYYTYADVLQLLLKIGFTVRDIRVEKIRRYFGRVAPIFLLAYTVVLRPLYFNTFHVLVQK